MELNGDGVARWLAAGDVERKLRLLIGGTFDDEREDAAWEITGEATAAGFRARMVPGGRLRVFRFADLRGLSVEIDVPSPEARAAMTEELAAAIPRDVKLGQEALRRGGYDPERLDEPALAQIGRFIGEVSAGRAPAPDKGNALYNLLKEESMHRVGAKLFADAFHRDPKSVLLRIQAATLARLNGDIQGTLDFTEEAVTGNLGEASRLQKTMLLTVRGQALVTAGRIDEAEQCAKQAWAIADGKDEDHYISALFTAIKAARK